MKKQFYTLLGGLSICVSLFSQENKGNLIPCNTFAVMEQEFNANPASRQIYEQAQAKFKIEYEKALNDNATKRTAAAVYTVPVVFHILHQNGAEKISEAQVLDAVSILNKDFNKQNADIANVISDFTSIAGDAQITFKLAGKDPVGKCTNGIIYHETPNTNWDYNDLGYYTYSGTGTGKWDPTKYLNVYVVKTISSNAAGYTRLPSPFIAGSSIDAIVILHNYVGAIGTGSSFSSRALTHEVGHWLNLEHTWGNTNAPGVSCGNDGISDTPFTKGFDFCPSSAAAAKICNASITENYQNFMEYSYCSNMFTTNQGVAMRTALGSSTAGRNNLSTSSNLIATGVSSSYACTPVADFLANKISVCSNSSVLFTSKSFVGSSGSVSWTFQGGSIATSTSTAPTVSYANPGVYSVTLTATNASGSNTITKTSYITVSNGTSGSTVPYTIDFESGIPNNTNVINYNNGSVAWNLYSAGGANSTGKSLLLQGSSSTGGHLDTYETQFFDLHNTTAVSLSYYYAYAKKTATQADTFRVQYSLDCGGTWTNILGVPSTAAMGTNSGGTTATPLVPSSAQWKQVNINTVLLTALSNKSSVKFRFYFKSDANTGSSNNVYIDQINLSGTVGLNDLENTLQLSVYPNPTNSTATVDFVLAGNDKINLTLNDILGRVVEETVISNIANNKASYIVNKNNSLAKGIYILNLDLNNQRVSKKIIIE